MKEENNISIKLIEKSVESFTLGLEIFNKPTIKYRVEGFSFFICNAWELMLKAYLVNNKGLSEIYHDDKPSRTLSLEQTIKKIFTNKYDPLRQNLERIISLRNTCTHFVTEDYEQIYAPLFQACVVNYVSKMKEFHNYDVTQNVATGFLTLTINPFDLSDETIKANYTPEVAEKLIMTRNEIQGDIKENNPAFSIPVITKMVITKKANEADFSVNVSKGSLNNVAIVHDIKDPSAVYICNQSKIIDIVNRRLKADNLLLDKIKNGERVKDKFTKNDFQLIAKFYQIKANPKYCYLYTIGNRYGYTVQTANFIYELIKETPTIIINIKEELKKQ